MSWITDLVNSISSQSLDETRDLMLTTSLWITLQILLALFFISASVIFINKFIKDDLNKE